MSGDNTATRQRRRAAGQCIDCEMPAARTQRCSVCNERNRDRARKAAPAPAGPTREERIRKVAAENPTLEVDMLAERFGCSVSTVVKALGGVAPDRKRRGGCADLRRATTPDRLMLFPFFGRRRR